jgi:hypothetical protein
VIFCYFRVRQVSSSSESSEEEHEDFLEIGQDLFRSKEGDHVRKSDRLRRKYNALSQPSGVHEIFILSSAEEPDAAADGHVTSEPDLPPTPGSSGGKLATILGKVRQNSHPYQPVSVPVATVEGGGPPPATLPAATVTAADSGGAQMNNAAITAGVRIDVRREAKDEADLVNDMIRAVSRNSSRPGSRVEVAAADSRPGSRTESRAGSRSGSRLNRKAFGVDPDTIEEPDRDSPVLTPRARHLEKERRESSLGLSPPKFLPVSVAPAPNDAAAAAPPSSPLRPASPKALEASSTRTSYRVTSLTSFDQIKVKKSKQEKVSKLLARQKRKAERLERKKYRGFGQAAAAADEGTEAPDRKRKEKAERMHKLKMSAARNSHITAAETELIASLLRDAENAVRQQSSDVTAAQPGTSRGPEPDTGAANFIMDFEESQTLSASQAHREEEQDFLFDF